MLQIYRRSIGLAALFALVSCGGGGGTHAVLPTQPAPGPLAGTSEPIAYGAPALVGAAPLGAARLGSLAVGVLVRMRDPAGLLQYAQQSNQPGSALYRQWLTPDQLADRFGATAADYQTVAQYFHARGLGVVGWRQRQVLMVRGTQAQLESALGATFGLYARNGQTFYALQSPPTALAGLPVAALVGANDYGDRARQFVRVHGGVGPQAGSGFSPQQIAAGFDFNGAYAAGFTGAGINVGVIGTGPIAPQDFQAYRSTFHIAGASTITQVNVTDGGTAGFPAAGGGAPPAGSFTPAPPVTDSCTIPATGPSATCNPEDIEAQLDTEQVAGLARDANVLFYLAYSPPTAPGNAGTAFEGIQLAYYELQQAISDNRADIVSMSFGEGEQTALAGGLFVLNSTTHQVDPANSLGPIIFASLAAEGIAAFASSGDNGNLGCFRDGNPATTTDSCVGYPAVDPLVVGVGGVTTPLDHDGRLVGPLTAWGLQTGLGSFQSASGGGVSLYFALPAYQQGATGISGLRNSPDISLEGDGATGVGVLFNAPFPDAGIFPVAGTSIAAPEAAAEWALVLQACKLNPGKCPGGGSGPVGYRLGNPNGLLYKIYASATQYPATFYDITFGDNSQLPPCASPAQTGETPCPVPNPTLVPGGFQAGIGYDRVTGIGVPFARALIRAIAGV